MNFPPPPPEEKPNPSVVQAMAKDHKEMTVSEILHLLRDKVQNGRAIPSNLTFPPWRLENREGTDPHQTEIINKVLNRSIEAQSSTIAKSGDFEEYILTNASLAIAGLIRHYLRACSVKVKVILGVLLWNPKAREGPTDYEGTPHIWVDIEGQPIDNTYVHVPAENLELYYMAKEETSYLYEDPFVTQKRLYLGRKEDGDDADVVAHNLRIYRDFHKDDEIEKYLVFALANCDLNPCVKMYDILMRNYLKSEQIALEDLEEKWSKQCWGCFDIKEELKKCGNCKLGRYCSVDCQRKDWKTHKLLHKELELTKTILSRPDSEES